jgi:hypothetical protein
MKFIMSRGSKLLIYFMIFEGVLQPLLGFAQNQGSNTPSTRTRPVRPPKTPRVQPHRLPDEIAQSAAKFRSTLLPLSTQVPAPLIAHLYDCNPYCEPVGKIVAADKKLFQDGLRVEFHTAGRYSNLRAVIARSPLAAKLEKAKVVASPPSSQASLAKAENTQATNSPTPSPGTKEARSEESWISRITPEISGQSFPLSTRLSWDLYAGKRSLESDAFVQSESDAGFHPVSGARIEIESPWAYKLWGLTHRPALEGDYRRSLWETPTSNPFGRKNHTEQSSALFELGLSKESVSCSLAPSFGLLQTRFFTDQNSPSGTPSRSRFWVLGTKFRSKWFDLRALMSLSATTLDATKYRGTLVESSLLSIEVARTFWDFRIYENQKIEIGGFLSYTRSSEQASGSPLDSSLETGAKHSYASPYIGIRILGRWDIDLRRLSDTPKSQETEASK